MAARNGFEVGNRTNLFISVAVANLAVVACGMATAWSSPVLEKLYSENEDNPLSSPITSLQASWIGSLLNVGAVIGAFPFAFLQRKIGRKLTLLSVLAIFAISYLMGAFAKIVELLFVVRILHGIAIGGMFTVIPTYMAEISDDAIRGMLSVTLGLFLNCGMLLTYCLGPFLSMTAFNLIELIAPILSAGLFFYLPETPYYLMERDNRAQAEAVLVYLRQKTIAEVQPELKQIETHVQEYSKIRGGFLDIFKTQRSTKAFIITLVTLVSTMFCGIGVVLTYTQSIFESANFSGNAAIPPIIIGAVQVTGSLISPVFIGRLDRKFLLIMSGSGIIISEALLGLYFYLQENDYDVANISWMPLITLVTYIISHSSGFGPIPWAVMGDLLPGNIRAIASSVITASANIASFLVVFSFIYLSELIGIGGSFWLYSGITLLTLVFIAFWLPETRGKSLQEIQEMLEP